MKIHFFIYLSFIWLLAGISDAFLDSKILLKGLVASKGVIEPQFSPSIHHYSIVVEDDVTSIKLTPIYSTSENLFVRIGNNQVPSEEWSLPIETYSDAPQVATINVEYEETAYIYTCTVFRRSALYHLREQERHMHSQKHHQERKLATTLTAPVRLCMAHSPPLTSCGNSEPAQESPVELKSGASSIMELSFEASLWKQIAGDTEPVDCNTTITSTGGVSIGSYCGKCFALIKFNEQLQKCQGSQLDCECDVFFGGFSKSAASSISFSSSALTVSSSLGLLAQTTLSTPDFNLFQPFTTDFWFILLITWLSLSVAAWFLEKTSDRRNAVAPSSFSSLIFAPFVLLGLGDKSMRSFSGAIIQFGFTMMLLFVIPVYVAQLESQFSIFHNRNDVLGPQDLYGKNVLTPIRYQEALKEAGIQPLVFVWQSESQTNRATLPIAINSLKEGTIDAIVIDQYIVNQIVAGDCSVFTSGGQVIENNYAFAIRNHIDSADQANLMTILSEINDGISAAVTSGNITSLYAEFLRSFSPGYYEILANSGSSCPEPVDILGFDSFVFLWGFMGMCVAAALVITFGLRRPLTRVNDGFSNFANYAEIGSLSDRMEDIEAKLTEIQASIEQLAGNGGK